MSETWVVICGIKLYGKQYESQFYLFDSRTDAEECQRIEEKSGTWDFVSLKCNEPILN